MEQPGASTALPQTQFLTSKPGDTLSRLIATAQTSPRERTSPSGTDWVSGIVERQQLLERERSAARRRTLMTCS